ncbi:hypothetical protein [Eleftheria terrae]|uniref:hypothetical protein n=1 Tax=Eleftheria terrae TaxID=1597781 RepID=UPI00263BAF6D|nr:hypothetical protein [Eleftheria terrae]WKB55674.1 hypothetical protein N7L95_26760 [Eleftheria terrae]
MPYNTDPRNNLTLLGREAKLYRTGAEQFCVFAMDLEDHKALIPAVVSRPKEKCVRVGGEHSDKQPQVANWLASYWTMSQPRHTEQQVLAKFDKWYSRYASTYGEPSTLYIYSFLIPCQRDGSNGHCADAIADMLRGYQALGKNMRVYVGWSNDDVDTDMAHATKHALADLEDDDTQIAIFPRLSIAG